MVGPGDSAGKVIVVGVNACNVLVITAFFVLYIGCEYLFVDISNLLRIHDTVLWKEDRSSEGFGCAAVEDENSPPQSSADFSL